METKHRNTLAAMILMLGSTVTAFGTERIPADELTRLAPNEKEMNQYTKVMMLDGSSYVGRKYRITGRQVALYNGTAWEGLPTDRVATLKIWPARNNAAHIRRAGRLAARVVTFPCTAMAGRQPVIVCLPLRIAGGAAGLGTSLTAAVPVLVIHDLKALSAEPAVYEVVH